LGSAVAAPTFCSRARSVCTRSALRRHRPQNRLQDMATDSRRSGRPSGSGHPLPLFGRSGARWQQHIDRPLTHPDRLNDETKESATTAAVSTVTKLEQSPDGRAEAPRPFGWRDKFGYMFGDFGNDFTFLLQSTFFLIFYTNVMGISAAHVGTLLFAARILDAFT